MFKETQDFKMLLEVHRSSMVLLEMFCWNVTCFEDWRRKKNVIQLWWWKTDAVFTKNKKKKFKVTVIGHIKLRKKCIYIIIKMVFIFPYSQSFKNMWPIILFNSSIIVSETKVYSISFCTSSETLKNTYRISVFFPQVPTVQTNLPCILPWRHSNVFQKLMRIHLSVELISRKSLFQWFTLVLQLCLCLPMKRTILCLWLLMTSE